MGEKRFIEGGDRVIGLYLPYFFILEQVKERSHSNRYFDVARRGWFLPVFDTHKIDNGYMIITCKDPKLAMRESPTSTNSSTVVGAENRTMDNKSYINVFFNNLIDLFIQMVRE